MVQMLAPSVAIYRFPINNDIDEISLAPAARSQGIAEQSQTLTKNIWWLRDGALRG